MDRSTERTVFVYRATGDNEQLGGNTRGIKNKNFHWKYYWSCTLKLASGDIVPKDDAELQRGNHYVDGFFCQQRALHSYFEWAQFPRNPRDAAFMTAIRNRDGRCAVSGYEDRGGWRTLQQKEHEKKLQRGLRA